MRTKNKIISLLSLLVISLTSFSKVIDTLTTEQLLKIAGKYEKRQNDERALVCYEQVLTQNPSHFEALLHRALILNLPCDFNIDTLTLNQLIKIGEIYRDRDNPEQSAYYFECAIQRDPTNNYTLTQAARMLRLLRNYDQAIAYQTKAARADPQNNEMLTQLYLENGEIEKAFDTKKRVMSAQHKNFIIDPAAGLGDHFMLIRYAKILKELGACVRVKIKPSLIPLFSLSEYIDLIKTDEQYKPAGSIELNYFEIVQFFYENIDRTIPTDIPYLKADPTLVQYWHEKLASDTNFKIGLCWHGSVSCWLNEHLLSSRSIPLNAFLPLLTVPGVSIYSLQQINGLDELLALQSNPVHPAEPGEALERRGEFVDLSVVALAKSEGYIHTFNPDFDKKNGAFMDTAAVMENLDLIISCDTSIVHLAGALGRPVWTILPYAGEWRWPVTDTDRSSWYPTMRLFRQEIPGNWDDVIARIAQEVKKIVA